MPSPRGKGARKYVSGRLNAKTKKAGRYYNCECFECLLNATPHPISGLPEKGSWIPERQFKIHDSRQRKHELASSFLPSAHSPQLSTPPSPRLSAPPATIPDSIRGSTDILQELDACISQIRPANDVVDVNSLQFLKPPARGMSLIEPGFFNENDIYTLCRLNPQHPGNSTVIGYEEAMTRIYAFASAHVAPAKGTATTRLKARLVIRKVERERETLLSIKFEEWKQRLRVANEEGMITTAKYYSNAALLLPPFSLALYIILATLHLLSGVSLDKCTFLLRGLKVVLRIMASMSTSNLTARAVEAIPSDMRKITTILDVSTPSKAFICCPTCWKPTWVDPEAPRSDLPISCQNLVKGVECGTPLQKRRKRKGGHSLRPHRRYMYHSVNDYLGRLYSRPDLQEYLYRDPRPEKQEGAVLDDIWDASCLQDFRGPDGKIFASPPRGDSHLVFSLNMDGLNPFGNVEAGKKATVGAMYIVCLNIPPSLRYKLENVYFIGIIPGPNSPSKDEINYFLKPLVDELLVLWNTGIYLSRTARYAHGCRVRCAVVPLVCDLPAGRQMSGISAYQSKYFCSVCLVSKDQICSLDCDSWKRRDWATHVEAAENWKKRMACGDGEDSDLPTDCEETENSDESGDDDHEQDDPLRGIHWSELLRLPYWNPVRFTIIDSMHAFYQRIIQYHCRDIWGMDVKIEDGLGKQFDPPYDPTSVKMREAIHTFRHGSDSALKKLGVRALRTLCENIAMVEARGGKGVLIKRLLNHRVEKGWAISNSKNGPHRAVSSGLEAREFFENASKKDMTKLDSADLLEIIRYELPSVAVNTPGPQLEKKKKKELLLIIESERAKLELPKTVPKPKKTRVLGKNVLAEIRRDMKRYLQPTWAPSFPSHPGEAKWGKLTADQWRAFCTQILPLTLVRLWGNSPAESRERKQLDNFMHLVTAVKLANMRSLTEENIKLYEEQMTQYLRTLLELYPRLSLTPYHHLSLHFGQFLRDFGPTHAWRCFPFERYNGVLQSIPANQKFGELEVTMFNKFCEAQNIRALFASKTSLPAEIADLATIFDKTFHQDIRGTLLNDILAHDDKFEIVQRDIDWDGTPAEFLSEPAHNLLYNWVTTTFHPRPRVPKRALFHRTLSRLGETYSSLDQSIADSHIVYRRDTNPASVRFAGAITSIFSHVRHPPGGNSITQTFAIVSPYQVLSQKDAEKDPYRRYPIAGGCLYYNVFDKEEIVPFENIACHFASCIVIPEHIGQECVWTLPLNKTS